MILDSSVVVAIVFQEPGFEALLDKMAAADVVAIGAPTLAETGVVLTARLGDEADGLLVRLIDAWSAVVIPFGPDHSREAVLAYARFGRGRHKARLNFGDCLTYAVAKLADQPLLATGNDFGKTDLNLA